MKQNISNAALVILGLAAVVVAVLVIGKIRNSTPGNSGADAMIDRLKTRRSSDHQRPTPTQQIGRTTPVDFESGASKTAADAQLANVDADTAGWETESWSESAALALHQIFAGETTGLPITADFLSTQLVPELTEALSESGIHVRRGANAEPPSMDKPSFIESIPKAKYHLKIARITQQTDGFLTRVIASTSEHRQQTTSIWDCGWQYPDDDSGIPRLQRLEVLSHEEVSRNTDTPLFEDITDAVLPAEVSSRDFPITHWAQRLTKVDDMQFTGHHGIAVGDADGDGLDDLYVCDAGGLPNRLFLQNPDGTARDVSAQAGVDWLEASRAALFLDLDNDGDQDLVVATVALILVLENDGSARFSLHGGIPGMADPHSLSSADYDGDGYLDLFVCNYGAGTAAGGQRGFEASAPVPFNDAKNGGRNALLRNRGNLGFSNVTTTAGLDAGGDRWSFAASWEDYDDDGDQDLYVANDFGRNNLFRNDDGRFTEVAATAGVEDISSGMSVAWGDADRDGKIDLYVGNMFSSAGGRVAYQRQFATNHPQATNDFQRMARGNTLFVADGDGTFSDHSESAAVNVGLWAWSSQFADINNDGWQDLVVANGYMTNDPVAGPDL